MATSANAKSTLGAVLGTVTTAAMTVTSVFEAGGTSAGMLNSYVSAAAEKQRDSIEIDLATHKTRLTDNFLIEETKRLMEMDVLFDANPKAKQFYEIATKRLEEALSARKSTASGPFG